MELPKYIQKKIEMQNRLISKAEQLELEIDSWCDKNGIDIYSREYQQCKANSEEAVGSIDKSLVERLLKKMKRIGFSDVQKLENGTRVYVECVGSEWYFSDERNYKSWNIKQEDGLYYEIETKDNTISFPYNYDYNGNRMEIACYIE